MTTLTHLPKFKTRFITRRKFSILDQLKNYLEERNAWKVNVTIRKGEAANEYMEHWVGLTAKNKEMDFTYAKTMRVLTKDRGRSWPMYYWTKNNINREMGNLFINFIITVGQYDFSFLNSYGQNYFHSFMPPEETEYDEDGDYDYDWGEDED